jgi:hypothetical protein
MTRWVPAAIVLSTVLAGTAIAQTSPPFGRVAKLRMTKFVSPVGNFQVEYPRGDWTLLSGPAGAVLAIAEYKKGEALVVIERLTLTEALSSDDMPPLADRETRRIKEREPGAGDLTQQVREADQRRIIILEYTRLGIQGPERVVQYIIPQGNALYRVVCTVVASQAAKYAPMFGHIAASIEPAPPSAPKKEK